MWLFVVCGSGCFPPDYCSLTVIVHVFCAFCLHFFFSPRGSGVPVLLPVRASPVPIVRTFFFSRELFCLNSFSRT